jgi:glycosyltransferase involved in cell wall biosynthesis
MTVVQILYSGLGGHSSVGFSLVEADTSKEFRHIIIFYGIEDMPLSSVEKCKELGIEWFFVKKHVGLDVSSQRQVISILNKTKPAVILLHSVNLIVPVFYYQLGKKARLIAVEHQPNHLKTKLEWIWSLLLMRLAARVVFLTDLYRSQMKEKLGMFFNDKKVHVVNNGININLFKPLGAEASTISPDFKIGMLARLMATKDHSTLIRSFKLLLQNNNTGGQLQLHIAGEGEEKVALEKLVEELELTDSVYFRGMIAEAGTVDFLNELDIYVHASLGETMSTSIMQAMACRKPVVASDVMGINNMIKDNNTGILVPAKDPSAMADAVANLLNDPVKSGTLAKNAFDFAVANYSNRRMLENYKSLF